MSSICPKEEYDEPILLSTGMWLNVRTMREIDGKNLWAKFVGSGFTGKVWKREFDHDWWCDVYISNVKVDTVSGETPVHLLEKVMERHGA
jgi:hypothetical protein